MMNEETEDAFVHHDDFTLSSEWEKFIDKLEKIIFKWKLHEIKPGSFLKKEDYVNGFWEVITESVEFADFKFDFRKYCLKPRKDENDKCTPVSPVSDEGESSEDFVRTFETLLDLNSSENCFIPPVEVGSPDMYCIVRWYGLREFLVLSPQPRHSISSESRLKILLSSVLIAVNNCSCPVPVFVQFHHPSNHYFVGVSEGSSGIRVDFEMAHLNSPPPGSHLSGLLDMFKYKIRDPSAIIGHIKVSAQFTYKIKNQTYIRQPAVESNLGECPFDTHLFFLPFKTHLNSWEIHLMATWPLLPEDAVVDRVGSSSFHPLSAPLWSIRMPFLSFPHPVLQPGRAISNLEKWEYPLLAQYLLNCISCTRTSSAHDNVYNTSIIKLIGGAEQDYDDLGLPPKAALDILTNSKVADITKVVNKATKSRLQKIWQGGNASQGTGSNQSKKPEIVEEGPIADDKLLPILHFLFPDADDNHKYSYPSGLTKGAVDEEETTLMSKKKTKFKKDCPWLGKRLKVGALLRNVQDPKTCPADSLTWRMALALAYVYQKFGGAMAAAHLWYEVTQEARYRWDKLIPLPGLVPGDPDHKTSLLNQKFQMLNCCIERRKKEKESSELQSSNNSSFNYDSENSEDEDDNFFDCPDVPPAGDVDNENKSGISQVHGPKLSLWNRPDGRLKKMKDVHILSTGEQLYVPVTQEVPPKTEDQIEEDAELMEMLGNDALGTELRASMMCASLLSDMESFKAANPSAELIDFIRWYSPRDWVEEESLNEFGQKKGHLSERMLLPGNKWQEVWKAAKPVPARRQKRLFNEGCVAEKVLHFLEVLSVSKIFRYIMPLLFQAALWKIGQEMHNLESSEGKAENPDDSDSEENLVDSTKNDKDVIDTMFMKNLSDNTPEPLLSEEISFPESVPEALKKIASRTRNMSLNPMAADQTFYTELIFELAKVESLVSMARGAQIQFRIDKHKLKVKDYLLFLKSLVCEEEAVILGGHKSPVGELVWNFIQQERWMDGKLLDEHLNAEQKEYVFQVMATRPAPYSRPTPQRLTAIVKEGEFRLAGAFSQDTNFF